MTPTHYQTLGVPESATQDEIKRAYRRLAKKYHPDHNKAKSAEARFKEINEAYQVLGDPGRRQVYDYDLAQSRKSGAGVQAPPPAQKAYRYLFFMRGVLVGGAAGGALLFLALVFYATGWKTSVEHAASVPRGEVAESKKADMRAPVRVEPTSAPPKAAPEAPAVVRRHRLSPTATSEAVASVPEPTPVPPPVHLSGKWRGCFGSFGERVPFVMRLEQHGSEVIGYWTEGHRGVISRANVRGSVSGSTVTLVRTYVGGRFGSASFVSEHSSSEFLRGIWEDQQGSGTWRAAWEDGLTQTAINPKASWSSRRPPSRGDCSIGWRQTLLGERAPCGAPPPHSSAP